MNTFLTLKGKRALVTSGTRVRGPQRLRCFANSVRKF